MRAVETGVRGVSFELSPEQRELRALARERPSRSAASASRSSTACSSGRSSTAGARGSGRRSAPAGSGPLRFITNAGYASWTVVFAKTDPSMAHRGISAFVVPMAKPGVQIEMHLDKMGQRSTDTSAFALTDVVAPSRTGSARRGRGSRLR